MSRDVAHPHTQAILDVELVPAPGQPNITGRLAQSIARAQSMRAVICYWTVEPDYVSQLLAARLSSPASFLCVDIHAPTDVDQLAALHERGARLRLHLRKLSSRTEPTPQGNADMPSHLMHAKLILFDMPDGTAEIWSGSHNWTRRALAGPNMEASLVVHVEQQSTIYQETCALLQDMYDLCEPFDPVLIDTYKRLQKPPRDETPEHVIFVFGQRSSDLANSVLTLIGTEPGDLQELRTVNQNVIVAIDDGADADLYHARVVHLGLLKAANAKAGGVRFSSDRCYASRDKQRNRFVLTRNAGTQRPNLDSSHYFMTLHILDKLPSSTRLVPWERRDREWIEVTDDTLIRRARSSEYTETAPATLVMQVPAFLKSPYAKSRIVQTRFLLSEDRALSKRLVPRMRLVDNDE